jgi:hypothetical protein
LFNRQEHRLVFTGRALSDVTAGVFGALQVRKTPSWPRRWINFSLA